uniref:NACHT LRR and PYD domain-containing protein n=1 Tax=Astyanax mexicanus TaxID=7994 RepID=W5LJJ9_ASTMX
MENPAPETTISLFHCLNELNDHSVLQEVQTYLNRGGFRSLRGVKLFPSLWSAVAFVMLNSKEQLDSFDLNNYVFELLLVGCDLSEKSCASLASALSSNSSTLRDLNLNNNNVQDSGVKLLSAGLKNPHCKLETLDVLREIKRLLNKCNLSEESCAALASALSSNSSTLRDLNLGNNNLQDSGVKLLSAGLKSSHCKLETLGITEEGCAALASALKSNPSHLRELDLRVNNPGQSGEKLLSDLQKDPHFKLEII